MSKYTNLRDSNYNSTASALTVIQGHSAINLALYNVVTHMSFYYELLFFPFGLLFNALILLVFGISPLGTTKTTRVFYLAMAYGELGTVLFKDAWYFFADLGIPFITGGFNPLGVINGMGGIGNGSPIWMCGLQVFMWYSHEMFANYIFVVFELERVIAVYSPLSARHFFTKKIALITVQLHFYMFFDF